MGFETEHMPEKSTFKPKPAIKAENLGSTPEEREKNEFHKRVADRVNQWLEEVGAYDQKMVYRPEKVGDGWHKVSPEDYFLHRISVIGLPQGSKKVTAEQVGQILMQYREAIASQRETVETVRSAYDDFNRASSLQVGEFDPERLFLLPKSQGRF